MKCKMKMTISGLWDYFSKSFRGFCATRLGMRCPRCQVLIPGFQSTCHGCGSTLTVEGVFEETIGPHRKRFKEMVAPTKTNKRIFHWVYLLASALVFWITFGMLERHYADAWVLHAMLSVIYLAVLLLVSLWVVPQKTLYFIARRTAAPVRLGIVFNYLTGLFHLQMYLTAWWSRSLMLAGLLVASWLGALVFLVCFLPTAKDVRNEFLPPESSEKSFDPRARQGRDVGVD